MQRMLFLTLVCCLAFPIFAQEADAPAEPATPLEVPSAVNLSEISLYPVSIARDTEADATFFLLFHTPQLHPLGTSHLQLGTSLLDARLRGDDMKIGWLPLSLYVVPVVETATFTKTGAARVTRMENTEEKPFDAYCTDTVITRTCRAQTDPNAKTTFTYTRRMVYGVVTANMTHLFDFGASPLRTENARAGIGVLWTQQRDIPNGIMYDIQSADHKGVTAPNAKVEAGIYGLELTRSLTGGDPTWYLTYTVGTQTAP